MSNQTFLAWGSNVARLCTCALLMAITAVTAQEVGATCVVEASGKRWCADTVTYSFVGSDWNNILNGGALMKLEVYNAVLAINTATQVVGTDIRFQEVPSGGQLSLRFGPVPGTGVAVFIGSTPPGCGPGCSEYGSGTITFQSDIFLTLYPVFDRTTVALHELFHAISLGHTTGCPSTHLMYENINPGEVKLDIDASIIDALDCIYGNPLYSTCGSYLRFIASWVNRVSGGALLNRGMCNGCNCFQTPEPLSRTDYVYELAISQSGGPFDTVATLTEGEWVDDEYVFAPEVPYTQAILRMRALDGSTLVSESFTWEPIDIGPVASGVDTEVSPAPKRTTLLANAPNPLNLVTDIGYALPRAAQVKLDIYDITGMKVATLVDEYQDAGYKSIRWDARAALSGVYFYQLQAGDFRAMRKMVVLR